MFKLLRWNTDVQSPAKVAVLGRSKQAATLGAATLMLFGSGLATAQSVAAPTASVQGSELQVAVMDRADVALPDAPGMAAAAETSSSSVSFATPGTALFAAPTAPPKVAGKYDKVILPGQVAPRLTVHDKVILGVRDQIAPFSIIGWVVDAGYEQATNGTPNYPQTGKGFGQRVGAAAARDSSEGIFDESILAPILHEDPRYYKMGSGHNFFSRAIYAATRPVLTRTDGGRQTINFAELGGDFGGSALTQLYYPQLNRSFDEVLKTFGGSLGGDALSYLVSEFLSDTLQAIHLKKTTRD